MNEGSEKSDCFLIFKGFIFHEVCNNIAFLRGCAFAATLYRSGTLMSGLLLDI